jgi:hypothetical protein
MVMVMLTFGCCVGTIGFVATWAFVYRIYGSLKID